MLQEDFKFLTMIFKADPFADENGAGITLFGNYVYSTGHTLIRDVFTTIISGVLFYNYFTVRPIHPTSRINIAHWIWKCVVSALILLSLFDSWMWRILDVNQGITAFLILISAIGIGIISIYYPEAILLSQSQIARISDLYDLIENLTVKPRISRRTRELIEYLETLTELHNDPRK
ncbi:MAG: hypothetical protein ACXAD7_06405 [Candidatus Kariarchaeaceae archaeon]